MEPGNVIIMGVNHYIVKKVQGDYAFVTPFYDPSGKEGKWVSMSELPTSIAKVNLKNENKPRRTSDILKEETEMQARFNEKLLQDVDDKIAQIDPLFRLTKKRKWILERIITHLNQKIETLDENSLGHMMIEENDQLTDDEKEKCFAARRETLAPFILYHDVLETVRHHREDWLLKLHRKEEREWENEWDIPLALFNEAIDETTDYLKNLRDNSKPEHQDSFYERIDLLQTLKTHRNQYGK